MNEQFYFSVRDGIGDIYSQIPKMQDLSAEMRKGENVNIEETNREEKERNEPLKGDSK